MYIAYIHSFVIIDNSEATYIKFNGISYDVLVEDYIKAAVLVQELPIVISNSLGVSPSDVRVVSITRSTLNEPQTDATGVPMECIIATVAIPKGRTRQLQAVIDSDNSLLYSGSSLIPSFIDKAYPITSRLGKLLFF